MHNLSELTIYKQVNILMYLFLDKGFFFFFKHEQGDIMWYEMWFTRHIYLYIKQILLFLHIKKNA